MLQISCSFDFLVAEAVVSLAAVLSAVVVLSAAAASFLAFFFDFFVVVSELVSVEVVPACAFARAGKMAVVSIRQKAIIHRVSFLLGAIHFVLARFRGIKPRFLTD